MIASAPRSVRAALAPRPTRATGALAAGLLASLSAALVAAIALSPVMVPPAALAQGPNAAQVSRLVTQADHAFHRGRVAEADALVKRALALDPENKDALLLSAKVAEAQAKEQEASRGDALAAAIIPKVSFEQASLPEALEFLKQQAARSSDGSVKPNIIYVPTPGAPVPRLTLELNQVPFFEALRYTCELTGHQYFVEKHAIVVRAAGPATTEKGPDGTGAAPAETTSP